MNEAPTDGREILLLNREYIFVAGYCVSLTPLERFWIVQGEAYNDHNFLGYIDIPIFVRRDNHV